MFGNRKEKIIPAFGDYLTYGYFPYYKENIRTYHQRLLQTVNTVLEVDLPAVENIDYYSIDKMIKQLLYILPKWFPYSNISQLSEKVGASGIACSLSAVFRESSGHPDIETKQRKLGKLTKPEKIYLNNPNYNAAFAESNRPIKAIRETFFAIS